jgi:hypothetical protein
MRVRESSQGLDRLGHALWCVEATGWSGGKVLHWRHGPPGHPRPRARSPRVANLVRYIYCRSSVELDEVKLHLYQIRSLLLLVDADYSEHDHKSHLFIMILMIHGNMINRLTIVFEQVL